MCEPGCDHVTATRGACLADDFALYADESLEWARLTFPLAMPQLWDGDNS